MLLRVVDITLLRDNDVTGSHDYIVEWKNKLPPHATETLFRRLFLV